jgi:hypothetical protein
LSEFDRGQEVRRTSAALTMALDDDLILVTTDGSAIAITLPLASEAQRKLYHVKKIDAGAGTVVVTGAGSDLINGAATLTLYNINDAVALLPEADNDAWWSV